MAEKIYRLAESIGDKLRLSEEEISQIRQVVKRYPMVVPEHYLSLIDPDDPQDPIKKMCIPSLEELALGGLEDTSGETNNTISSGVQHKYRPTVLFLSTNTCMMYCRYCFRKRMVGLTEKQMIQGFGELEQYVREHKEINNVLISGGDPLTIKASVLASLLERLSSIDHLDFVRIGSRVPVVAPNRILQNQQLLDVLKEYSQKKTIYLVTHINHPKELSPETLTCLERIRSLDILISNQSVLLRGINDDVDTLVALMRRLNQEKIIPYYLFQCRPVKGAKGHFQVPLVKGSKLVEEAKHQLNGHEKRFRYCMSHVSGKIEILGSMEDGNMVFKYHEAKEDADLGRIFVQTVKDDQGWL